MENVFVDLTIEGTTLADVTKIKNANGRVAVVSKENHYGPTYKDDQSLKESLLIENVKILHPFSDTLNIEALPFLIKSNSPLLNYVNQTSMASNLKFANISDVFYIDGKYSFRYPNNKTEIANNKKISRKNKYFFHKAIKEGDFSVFTENCITDNDTQLIIKAFTRVERMSFAKYAETFGDVAYVHPVYGHSEIVETLSMSNALKGVIYLLSNDLEYSESDEFDKYNFKFNCNLGTLHSKEFITQSLLRKKYYVRVIETKKQKFNGCFMAFLEADEIITVIGLDATVNASNDFMQLLYFIKKNSPVTREDMEILQIYPSDRANDITFETVFDLNQFE